jgi:Dehydrogenases with different specificities (related to short-chain alcohol dehydrogenases)
MLDLTGKTALVTGGARGIGKAICLNLARQGADVAFVDVGRPEVAEATVAEIRALGRRALSIAADVTDPDACVKAVAAVVEAFGKVDILRPATT